MKGEIKIFLLGRFSVLANNFAVRNSDWQKRSARLLVQILALNPLREIHREELMEILFPKMDEKSANANLHRILYAARRALEPNRSSYASSNFLLTEGQQIRLTAEKLWIDAEEFKNTVRNGLKCGDQNLLESAAGIYRGDLLANEPFEDLFINQREELKGLFHLVLRRLAETAEKQSNFEESHHWLDRILQQEPADEIVHRGKMRLYEKQGERSRALKQYEKCREALKRELFVEPEKETEELRKRICLKNEGLSK